MKSALPRARREGLIIKFLPAETLVYDLDRDKAHCLNQTASLVWKNCDGKKSPAEIRQSLEREINTSVDERLVWLALNQLERFNLLTDEIDGPLNWRNLSRRELVKHIGVAALALPVILSIAAPTAAQGGSGLSPGACCTSNPQCQSGVCVPNPGAGCPPPGKTCS